MHFDPSRALSHVHHCLLSALCHGLCAGLAGTEESQEDGASEVDKETIHRLCPTYATDINSPLRHVRTRIYYTSESHVHSLVNVLRYSHLSKPCLPMLCLSWHLVHLLHGVMAASYGVGPETPCTVSCPANCTMPYHWCTTM